MNSILDSMKQLLGMNIDDEDFNAELIIHINSVFTILHDIGVGPVDGFSIGDETATWDLYPVNSMMRDLIKTYMFLKIKMVFDPSASSSITETTKSLLAEYEWRLQGMSEYKGG